MIHDLTRRRLLIAAAGASASLLARPLLAGEAKPQIRFGFTTYTWGKEWDIPTLIANCKTAGVFGTELRTSGGYAHGVELTTSADRRREVKKQFADSPVKLVGLATGESFHSADPAKLKAAIEAAKKYLQLSADVGASGIRVFPNDFVKDVPHEQTFAQIARALNEVGKAAKDLGQEVRLEAHGSAGELASLRAIMDQVDQPAVGVKLNSDARDTKGAGFEANFNLVKDRLAHTLHLHDLRPGPFPYVLQLKFLAKANWDGWCLLEASHAVPDRVKALTEQRELFDAQLAEALKA